jgi:hypothetical protein
MNRRNRLGLLLFLILPLIFWLQTAIITKKLARPLQGKAVLKLMQHTPNIPVLLLAIIIGFGAAFLLMWLTNYFSASSGFEGAKFYRFLRGTKIVSSGRLKSLTQESGKEQISIAGIPMPIEIENLHTLIVGSTGAGKSVALRELAYSSLLRGDRMIILDPDSDMLSKFWQESDIILNPYDARTVGWSFFNEIHSDYDFKRYALSIVPRGKSDEAEEWAGYARLLLRETARKLHSSGNPDIRELFRWTTIAEPEDLKEFLAGTDAESLFVGSPKALASARFVLSDKLPEHLNMPTGNFSLRSWLENEKSGNLFITWREDMAESLKPLISCWVDVICTSILSLPSSVKNKPTWLMLDELASLEKLASLEDAMTKGRKKELRVVAGLQSTAQLENVYGVQEAQTIRACFRSLVVLGGAKTDPKTCEDMSKALGEHEVEREDYSENIGNRNNNNSTNRSITRVKEPVIMPSQIASLPNLTGYIAFAGNRPIGRVELEVIKFKNRIPSFQERVSKNA